MSLGNKIEAARKAAGLTVAQLAVLVGATEKAVRLWERDERHPRFENMVEIARATGESLEHFAGKETQGDAAADTAVHR